MTWHLVSWYRYNVHDDQTERGQTILGTQEIEWQHNVIRSLLSIERLIYKSPISRAKKSYEQNSHVALNTNIYTCDDKQNMIFLSFKDLCSKILVFPIHSELDSVSEKPALNAWWLY